MLVLRDTDQAGSLTLIRWPVQILTRMTRLSRWSVFSSGARHERFKFCSSPHWLGLSRISLGFTRQIVEWFLEIAQALTCLRKIIYCGRPLWRSYLFSYKYRLNKKKANFEHWRRTYVKYNPTLAWGINEDDDDRLVDISIDSFVKTCLSGNKRDSFWN